MYKVYVIRQKHRGSEVLPDTRTSTPLFAAAEAAFRAMQEQAYDDNHLLLMTKENRQINAYRYGSQPGDRDYLPPGAPLSQ